MLKSMCEGSEAQRPRFQVPPAPLTPAPWRYRELEGSERLSWPRPGSRERRGPGDGTGEAALGRPPRGLRVVPTDCLPLAPLSGQSPGRGPHPQSAEWVLLTASGMVPGRCRKLRVPWEELVLRPGGELPISRGVHLELGDSYLGGQRAGGQRDAPPGSPGWEPRPRTPCVTFGSGWLGHH